MLLLTFTAMLAIKDLHFHHYKYDKTEQESTHHKAELKSSCFVCDFTMHKASEAKTIHFCFTPICVYLHKPKTYNTIIVYRQVESVNAHAPPFCKA